MRGELLGKITKKARRRGGRSEKPTEYDKYLIEQYDPPGETPGGVILRNQPASLLPGGITYVTGFQQAGKPAFAPAGYTRTAPPELVPDVTRAYFRLRQYEKRLNGRARAAASKPAASADLPKFVRSYIASKRKTASLAGLRNAWKGAGHGAHRRRELDAEWRRQARPLGLLRARGQTGEIA